MTGLSLVTTAHAFAALEPDWDRCAVKAGLLGPFNRFDWQFEWWRALGRGRELTIVTAHYGGQLTGLLPAFIERSFGAKTLRLLGSVGGGADYLDIHATDAGVCGALFHKAISHFRPDRLILDDLLESSPSVPIAAGTGDALVEHRFDCPHLPIDRPWEAFLKGAPRRENLRRRLRWFAAQPGFRIRSDGSVEAVSLFLERFRRLHGARWSEAGGTQAFSDPRLVAFHEAIAPRLARRQELRLWTMEVAGNVIAVAYGLEHEGRALYYQCGFSPDWAAKSAGLVLLAAFLEDAFHRGLSEIDFLRGSEDYKRDWATASRRTVRVDVALTAQGQLARRLETQFLRARRAAHQALPQTLLVPTLRRVRSARLGRMEQERTSGGAP